MKFETEAQEQCYNKIGGYIRELYGESAIVDADSPTFAVEKGSADARVGVAPWADNEAIVWVASLVVTGARVTSELMRFLLETNSKLHLGAFSIDKNGDIFYRCHIPGLTCDKTKLRHAIRAVLAVSDKYDDEIIAKWGGRRAVDRDR